MPPVVSDLLVRVVGGDSGHSSTSVFLSIIVFFVLFVRTVVRTIVHYVLFVRTIVRTVVRFTGAINLPVYLTRAFILNRLVISKVVGFEIMETQNSFAEWILVQECARS